MRLLVDTNILLEIILQQERAEEAQALLNDIERHVFFLSDYSLHSVGLLLFRHNQHGAFRQLVQDLIVNSGMALASLSIRDIESLVKVAQKFTLDFDDAYQYVVAEKHELILVSFDTDFDRTERGRKTPVAILRS